MHFSLVGVLQTSYNSIFHPDYIPLFVKHLKSGINLLYNAYLYQIKTLIPLSDLFLFHYFVIHSVHSTV